jgi:glycosyltransferase involved in cell wall biosynthesis
MEDAGHESSIIPRSGRFRCVIAGALIEGKGQEDAVLAFAHLKRAGIDAELLIVGDGDINYRRRLEEMIESNCVRNQVVLVGQVKNALPAMRSSDAVLVCSRSEAFGRVTIEGMLAGKPVIGAQSGATSELIQNGINGLFYRLGDPKDLADKIQYLYENRVAAERLAKNARAWAESSFTSNRYGKELLKLLTSLLDPVATTTSLDLRP